jgi:hypothetical protein
VDGVVCWQALFPITRNSSKAAAEAGSHHAPAVVVGACGDFTASSTERQRSCGAGTQSQLLRKSRELTVEYILTLADSEANGILFMFLLTGGIGRLGLRSSRGILERRFQSPARKSGGLASANALPPVWRVIFFVPPVRHNRGHDPTRPGAL